MSNVEVVALDAAKMVTIGPDAAGVWSPGRSIPELGPGYRGAFVRLKPPPGADAGRVRELEERAIAAGAAAVKVYPWKGATSPLPPGVEVLGEGLSPRAVVMAMSREKPSADVAALEAVLARLMDEEGV